MDDALFTGAKDRFSQWSLAEQQCNSKCGHVAVIHTSLQNKQVAKYYAGVTWIGLKRGPGGGKYANAKLSWVDGSTVDYKNVYHIPKSNRDAFDCNSGCDKIDCVLTNFYKNGYWDDQPCKRKTKYPAVCSVSLKKLPTEKTGNFLALSTNSAPFLACQYQLW